MSMKIATWNVNSLRVRMPQLIDWLAQEQPDIVALQETKINDADFPRNELQQVGYYSIYSGQPAYNGVAILSVMPPSAIQIGIPGFDDPQCRFLTASYDVLNSSCEKIRLVNIYVPNGQKVGSDKYQYKLTWLAKLNDWLKTELTIYQSMVVVGDYNIAPTDHDVYDPIAWRGHIAVSIPERAAFNTLLALGFSDAFRLFEQAPGSFSWWDYRSQAFRRNLGLRIDHILLTASLRNCCSSCYIDKRPRFSARPSDHTPVVAVLS